MSEPEHTRQMRQTQPDDAAEVMTRFEQELRITTHRREAQRARLTKYVETVTRTITHTAALRREQVQVEYLPPSDRHSPVAPADVGERWLVLYEEEVVIQTRWVARERVRLVAHRVTEQREVSELVRRERLALETDDAPGDPSASAPQQSKT